MPDLMTCFQENKCPPAKHEITIFQNSIYGRQSSVFVGQTNVCAIGKTLAVRWLPSISTGGPPVALSVAYGTVPTFDHLQPTGGPPVAQ